MKSKDYKQFSHDALNALGRLCSIAELAEIKDPELLELFIRDAENLEKIIKKFTQWGWITSEPEIEKTRFEVGKLIHELLLKNHSEEVLLELSENVEIITNMRCFVTIFLELLENMIIHKDTGTSCKIVLRVKPEAGEIVFENKSKKTLPKSPFFPHVKGEKSTGSGIGLTMCQATANYLGMNLTITQKGTSVITRLKFKRF